MKVNKTQFNKLRKFKTASWAVWNVTNLDFFKFQLAKNRLRRDVIFLGLNRSEPIFKKKNSEKRKYEFGNFHQPGHMGDAILLQFVHFKRLSNLVGAYMTDIYEIQRTKLSKLSKKKKEESVDNLFKQIQILGSRKITLVCFGDRVYSELLRTIGVEKVSKNDSALRFRHFEHPYKNVKYQIDIYRVMHYSNWGKHKEMLLKLLPKQLKYINEHLKKL